MTTVHRDVKDENVVLGPNGQCIMIDFGSSGLVKKGGWDTFSGTQVYHPRVFTILT
jgi:serine/threonine protein kinase